MTMELLYITVYGETFAQTFILSPFAVGEYKTKQI